METVLIVLFFSMISFILGITAGIKIHETKEDIEAAKIDKALKRSGELSIFLQRQAD